MTDAEKKQLKADINRAVSSAVENEVTKQMKTSKHRNEVASIVSEVMVRFYKLMYNRSASWSKDISKV